MKEGQELNGARPGESCICCLLHLDAVGFPKHVLQPKWGGVSSFLANWFLPWSNIDVSLHPSLVAQDGALMGI